MSIAAVRRIPAGRRPTTAFVLGAVVLAALAVVHLGTGRADVGIVDALRALVGDAPVAVRDVVEGSRLPRTTTAVFVGACLGMSGCLLQGACGNPLAEPSTLGANAGAYLAVVAVTITGVSLEGPFRGAVAFGGGLAAAALAMSIGGRNGAAPTRLVLAGVAVSLTCMSIAATLLILHEQQASALFVWGQGSVVQNDYDRLANMAPVAIVAAGLAIVVLAGRLDVLGLGDLGAAAVGDRPAVTRVAASVLGVVFAAAAVTVAGPLGFVGLAAPHLVRAFGVRRHRALLPLVALWGAALVVAADIGAQWLRPASTASELPAGVITAVVGAPFLVLIARRFRGDDVGRTPAVPARRSRLGAGANAALVLGLVAAVVLLSLTIGDVDIGVRAAAEVLAGGGDVLDRRVIVDFRLPRVIVALLAGAALGASGAALQAVTRNPLADPSLLGVTGGAIVGALACLFVTDQPSAAMLSFAAIAGALASTSVVLLASWRSGLDPERLTVVGVSVAALAAALADALVVRHSLRVAQALTWLAGSTYAKGAADARLIAVSAFLVPMLVLLGRHLDLLALGDEAPRSLGMRVDAVRLVVVAATCVAAGVVASVVGSIGFVGLLAAHLARPLAGVAHRRVVPIAAMIGALLVTLADLLGRSVLAPREIPAGLVVACLGAPYFVIMLARQAARANALEDR